MKEAVSSYGEGKDNVHEGDAWAALIFEQNYTDSVIQRYEMCGPTVGLKSFSTPNPGTSVLVGTF